jgi:hypothetical protein
MKGTGNWLGWILQFILGFIVGVFFGWIIINRRRMGPWMMLEAIPWFLVGAGLITGSVASYMGDRLWIGDNYRVIPPDSPEQTAASVITSIAIGLAGVACAAYALMLHFDLLKA